jgi:hypothetical protein
MTLPYTYLSLAERREIYRFFSAQIPVPAITQRQKREAQALSPPSL